MKIVEMIDVLSKAELKPNGDYANVEIYDTDFEKWMLCLAPSWDFFSNEYRIKPETKRVALTQQDLIERRKLGFDAMWVKSKDTSNEFLITRIFDNGVGFYDGFCSYDSLKEFHTFLDGTPCYKEVE